MSLEESLSKLISEDDASPVDIAMALLDPKKAIMTTDIKNVGVMTALGVYVAHYGNPDANNGSYSPKSALVMKTIYDLNVLHNVGAKRARANEIVKIFTGLQIFLGLTQQQDMQQGKSGLLGGKKR